MALVVVETMLDEKREKEERRERSAENTEGEQTLVHALSIWQRSAAANDRRGSRSVVNADTVIRSRQEHQCRFSNSVRGEQQCALSWH